MDENTTTGTLDGTHLYSGPAEGPLRELLARHVPISLIMDLAMPGGPHSRELFAAEGLSDTPRWERR